MHLSLRKNSALPPRGERGSLLIVAMLLAAVIGISLASYIALGQNSLKLANRSFFLNAATNLAESGLEEAMWAFNQTTAGSTSAWNGWNMSDGVSARRRFTDFVLSGNASPWVKVYVDHYQPAAGTQPTAVVMSRVQIPNDDRPVYKMFEVILRRRSKFAMGLVAKNQITFNGNNASVDSWNSDPDNNPATAAIPYSIGVRNDHGSVGSTSVAVGSVAVNNADIWGFASVGTSGTTGLSVGGNGTVASFTTNGLPTPQGTIDTTRVATDFTANFNPETDPTTGSTIGSIGATLGTAGTTTIWRFAGQINSSLTVAGNVTLILTGAPGVLVIKLTGAGDGINIPAGSSLIIYTKGDVTIAGNGVLNGNNEATAFQLWGTSPNTSPPVQDIKIAGNGALKGIVYAPNANVSINGNGDVMGSIVANNITVTGNAAFHYDESLANWGGNNPFGIVRWRELTTAAERAPYDSIFPNF